MVLYLILWLLACYSSVESAPDTYAPKCQVRARIESGWLCGLQKEAERGEKYASFIGIPYGRQPLGELRFKELQPVEPWSDYLNATKEGPVCPQEDRLYGDLVDPPSGMSEACIYANVHVPYKALPVDTGSTNQSKSEGGSPIFVFIHGGGFMSGSGNADLHGPEYLVSKGFIVITFNYRLNVFGFLSLNTSNIPGNAGLRDQLTLLRWVQKNAQAFGGNPKNVTLAGQSAGAASAHLLALNNESNGLFKRVILMSGTAIPSFYTASPNYASMVSTEFLKILGINSTNPDSIYKELINMPLEKIVKANSAFQDKNGLMSFGPVVEDKFPQVTRMLDDDPVNLIKQGRDKSYPMIVGFANNECEFMRELFCRIKMLTRINEDPKTVLAAGLASSTPKDVALELGNLVLDKYFDRRLTYNNYMFTCRDTLFKYPAFQLARWRAEIDAAPTYLYQFAYDSDESVLKKGLGINYQGATHIEDLTYFFRENVVLGDHKSFPPNTKDDEMRDWMTNLAVNFTQCNDPSCGKGWQPVSNKSLTYQLLDKPGKYNTTDPTSEDKDMIQFHDKIHQMAKNATKS